LKRKSAPVDKLEALNFEKDLEFIPDSPKQIWSWRAQEISVHTKDV